MLLGVQHADPERRQHLVKRKRQVFHVKIPDVNEGPWHKLRAIDKQVGTPLATWLPVTAGVCERADGPQRVPCAEEVRGARAAHELGTRVDQRRQVVQVQLAGDRIESGQPVVHPPPEPRQDLTAHRIPRHVVRVVLHRRGHHVVAVAEFAEQRVHDRVVGLGGIPVQRDAGPVGRADEPCDRVVGLFEQRGHRLRGARLTAVHVVISGRQGPVEREQFVGRLRARCVVRDDPAQPGEREVLANGVHIHRRRGHPAHR
jgi:hypothetical protein